MTRFQDKIVIVTGAAAGIGAATARLFSGEGAIVAVLDVDDAGGAKVADELGAAEGRAVYHSCDIGDFNAIDSTFNAIVQRFGRIDVLVNNAAMFRTNGVAAPDMDPELWRRGLDVNVGGTFFACRAAILHMRKSGGGAIVNLGSVSGMGGDYNMVAYNTAKGAVLNMTRALALDHGADKIRVNAVNPTGTVTSRDLITRKEVADIFLPRIPLGRYGTPDDIAKAILFLASDDAAFITGVDLPVDGGLTAASGQPDMRAFMGGGQYARK